MKQKTSLQIVVMVIALAGLYQPVSAQMPADIEPFVAPFGTFHFKRPAFRDTSISIVHFGAKEGGVHKNTDAINNAIKQLAASGGGKKGDLS